MSFADGRLLVFARLCSGAPVYPDALCRRGISFFTYGFLLAPRPFVQPTLPVRAVQAGLSTAERRGGRRSQPRWLSAAASVARPKKETKKSPGMRFPAPDSRRNGKSHIPGPAVFTRTSGTNVRRRKKEFLTLRFLVFAILQNRRLSRCRRALRPGVCPDGGGRKADK